MRILEWLTDLAPSFKRAKVAATHIAETLEEVDEKLRAGMGLDPRGEDGQPIKLVNVNGRRKLATNKA